MKVSFELVSESLHYNGESEFINNSIKKIIVFFKKPKIFNQKKISKVFSFRFPLPKQSNPHTPPPIKIAAPQIIHPFPSSFQFLPENVS